MFGLKIEKKQTPCFFFLHIFAIFFPFVAFLHLLLIALFKIVVETVSLMFYLSVKFMIKNSALYSHEDRESSI